MFLAEAAHQNDLKAQTKREGPKQKHKKPSEQKT